MSTRRIRPLASWCEDRGDYRSFRVDRLEDVLPTGARFPNEPGRDLIGWRLRGRG